MTLYLNFRQASVGGGIVQTPYILDGDGLADDPPKLRSVREDEFGRAVAGRRLLFAAHGFNVSYRSGVRVGARLEQALNLGEGWRVIAVLWPGDYWLPVVNYPAEAKDAVRCGRLMAEFINRTAGAALSVSLASHSLGARVVLEAAARLAEPAAAVCLTAGAVDDDVLAGQYREAARRARRINALASTRDKVLKLAYPLGDFVSDALYDDDGAFGRALGLRGSRPPRRTFEHQIPGALAYDHGDYFPPADLKAQAKWRDVVAYIRRCLLDEAHAWPPAGAP